MRTLSLRAELAGAVAAVQDRPVLRVDIGLDQHALGREDLHLVHIAAVAALELDLDDRARHFLRHSRQDVRQRCYLACAQGPQRPVMAVLGLGRDRAQRRGREGQQE
jgi:hypothetical protein